MAIQFFGQYLLVKGIITGEQLLKVVEYQELQNLRIGEFAVRQGLLTEADAARVNQLQLSKDIRFGEAAIMLGLLTEKDVHLLLAAQRNSHVYFGEAVVLLRFAAREVVEKALEEFKADQTVYQRETIAIPKDVAISELAADLFDLTKKLLLRFWGINSKLGSFDTGRNRIDLYDFGVSVDITGEQKVRFVLGVEQLVAERGARQILHTNHVSREECEDVTREFANVVCGNMVSRMSQSGISVALSPPTMVPSPLVVGAAMGEVVALDLATPFGSAKIVLVY